MLDLQDNPEVHQEEEDTIQVKEGADLDLEIVETVEIVEIAETVVIVDHHKDMSQEAIMLAETTETVT